MTLVSWVSILVMCIFGWISYIQRRDEAKKRNQLQADLNQKFLEEQLKRNLEFLEKNTWVKPIQPVSFQELKDGHLLPVTYVPPIPSDAFQMAIQPPKTGYYMAPKSKQVPKNAKKKEPISYDDPKRDISL